MALSHNLYTLGGIRLSYVRLGGNGVDVILTYRGAMIRFFSGLEPHVGIPRFYISRTRWSLPASLRRLQRPSVGVLYRSCNLKLSLTLLDDIFALKDRNEDL